MVDVKKEGAFGKAKDEVGLLQGLIDAAPEGSVVVFPATELSTYLIYDALVVTKSLSIVGDGAGVSLLKRLTGSAIRFEPVNPDSVLRVDNLTFISGTSAIEISSSVEISPISHVKNSRFYSQDAKAISYCAPAINFRIENCYFDSGSVGFFGKSNAEADFLIIRDAYFRRFSDADIYISKSTINPRGKIHVENSLFSSSNYALRLRAAHVSGLNNAYDEISNSEELVLGSTYISSSTNSVSGSGVTAHSLLTGLDGDDHPQYLHVSGTRNMAFNLNMGGFDITNVDEVDGRDVSADGAALDAHILDTGNPHATSIANIDPGTLAQLNAALSNANVDDSGSARTPLAHSASHYSGSTDPLDLQELRAHGLASDLVLVSDGLGGWTTAASGSLAAGGLPGAHASTHLSGAVDQISAQDLAADGIAVDRLLISDGSGGWTTVLSQSLIDSGAGLTEGEHETLDTHVHNIAEDNHTAFSYTGSNLTIVTIWTTVGKTDKVRETFLEYGGAEGKTLTRSVAAHYDSDGSTILSVLSKSLFYDGSDIDFIETLKV